MDLRYKPWSDLTPQDRAHAERLDYDATSWDDPGQTNPIELLNWSRLTREQAGAASRLGYDRSRWDCWQNHFLDSRWIDLGRRGVRAGQWWEDLGWDIYSWNQYADPPPSDSMGWYGLTPGERRAAAQLCYTRASWNEGDEGMRAEGGFPVARPDFRYRAWTDLEAGARRVAADGLKYSALSWNVPGLDEIETREWAALTSYESEAATEIGFTQLSWDCWQNHFRSYSWAKLYFYGLDMPYSALGWTELSWDGTEAAPASKGMAWKDLSQEERRVASSELCYFRDNWDGLDMTLNDGPFLLPKVKSRYVPWDEQPADARRMASGSLLYDETSWNNPGTAAIEARRWEGLTEHQRADATSLGFYCRTWDCFQNHYRDYEWDDVDRDSRGALRALGWSEANWDQTEAPPPYGKEWSQLSEAERSAATVLCFFEDNWDGNSLEREATSEGGAVEGTGAVDDGSGVPPQTGPTTAGSDFDAQVPDEQPQAPVQGLAANAATRITNVATAANSVDPVEMETMMCVLPVLVGTFVHFLL